ncbi:hypothetical protein [Clostridium sp.]|uniref:hypothetical protein n=1 Tax=Clostridium sp. TaxID=1506 RepID=UPI00257BF3C5|nr:hypothetical protein [Clostridium sp.]
MSDIGSTYNHPGFEVEIMNVNRGQITNSSIATQSGTNIEYKLSVDISAINTNVYLILTAYHIDGRQSAYHGFTLLSLFFS